MNEMEEMRRKHAQHIREEAEKQLKGNAHLIEAFIAFCKEKGISLTPDNFSYQETIGIIATFPNLVHHIAPTIQRDKEGLVDFTKVSNEYKNEFFNRGYLCAENYMLMAHPYFRRGFHENANYAPDFVGLFWGIDDPHIEPSIALDFNRVRINVDSYAYREFDTWYGPKFNKDIATISDGNTKLSPPFDMDDLLILMAFDNAYSLDIKWETKGRIKSFQAEEFKTEKIKITKEGFTYYPVRYVHAEFDLDKNHFRHFDGAIHFYTEEEYYARRKSDFNYNAKNSI